MNFKKYLKRSRTKTGQVFLEYVILVVIAIVAMLAAGGIAKSIRGYPEGEVGEISGFELHFRQVAAPAGGLEYVE